MIENLDIDVLAGIPFMESNDISVRPLKHQVLVGDSTIYTYGDSLPKHLSQCDPKAQVLRTVAFTTIWPRDYLEVDVPKSILDHDGLLAAEPCLSGTFGVPSILHSEINKIRIENTGCNPVSLRKHEHFFQVHSVYVPLTDPEPVSSHTDTKNTLRTHVKLPNSYSSHVTIDPDDILTLFRLCKNFFARNDIQYLALSPTDIMDRQDNSKLELELTFGQ